MCVCYVHSSVVPYVQRSHPVFVRGMEGTLDVTQVQFCPSFKPHEEGRFLKQLLTFAAEQDMGPSVRCFIDTYIRVPCVYG